MTNRILSTSLLAALIAGLATTGCGAGTASPSGGSAGATTAVASAAMEMERDEDRDEERREGENDRDDDRDEERRERDRDRVRYLRSVLSALRDVPQLAPLFELYQVPAPISFDDDASGLAAMLRAVRITVKRDSVTIANRRTGGIIYRAPLDDLDSGTFRPENLPGGTGTPPPVAVCTSFSYSAWGACEPSSTQTRVVTGSSPEGCTGGTPVVSQACTYTPPVVDGAALYTAKCGSCHGPLATSDVRNRTAQQITAAGMTMGLTVAEVEAVAKALADAAPVTCSSFTYSAWGACQPDDTQTRTVTGSSPAGCTGGSPVTSQACTYVPPVTTCTSFTYSAWGACQPDDTQTRTVTGSSPAGCTGGSPVTSQACTYVPPVCTYTYSAWSACSASGQQTRTVVSSSPAGCAGTPVLSQACTPPAPACGTCHSIPPSTGRHTRHTSFASCSTCHGTGYSTTTVNAATHQDGTVNTTATPGYNPSTNTCTTSCHNSRSW